MEAGPVNGEVPGRLPDLLRYYSPMSHTRIPLLLTFSKPSILSGMTLVLRMFSDANCTTSNYWTHQGGLPEVIGVLPSKEQADM